MLLRVQDEAVRLCWCGGFDQRQGRLGETRNDHQVATARRFAAEGIVRVADSPNELSREIARLEQPGKNPRIPSHAQPELLDRLRTFATNS